MKWYLTGASQFSYNFSSYNPNPNKSKPREGTELIDGASYGTKNQALTPFPLADTTLPVLAIA
jgi:hypothetical protein